MKQLIKITEQNGEQIVSARELHVFLESKQEFASWIKNRIKKYDLIENEDYTSFDNFIKREIGGSVQIEYALTLDCAKELAMVEGNAKGKQARKYFISCEKLLKDTIFKQLAFANESAKQRFIKSTRIKEIDVTVKSLISERQGLVKEINSIDRSDFRQFALFLPDNNQPFSLTSFLTN